MTEPPLAMRFPPSRAWAAPSLGLAVAALLLPPTAALAPLAIAPLLAGSCVLSLMLGAHRRLGALVGLGTLIVILGLLCLWGTASALWSILPLQSLLEGLRLFAIVVAGLVMVAVALDLDVPERDRLARALLWGFLIALALLAVAALARATLPLPPQGTAMALWLRGYSRFDRGATTLALAIWPTLLVVGRSGAGWRRVGLFLATALVVFGLPSRAAMLSMLVGLVALPIGLRMPRLAAGAIGAGVLCLVLASSLATLDSTTISRINQALPWLQNSALHRLAIWHFAMERIDERPLLGWGLDSSRALPAGSTLIDDPSLPERLIGYGAWMPLHPHNAVLQWRLELGLPGLALCTLGVLWILARIADSGSVARRSRAIGLSLTASTLVVALVSYGVWQAWWQATFWLLAAVTLAISPFAEAQSSGVALLGDPGRRLVGA